MSWSSPVRKSGTVNLSPIPNELYLEIFSYLRPSDPNEWIGAEVRQEFCSLALVCRFFSSVMLPWIFENLKFIEKNSYSQSNSSLSSTVSAKFCRSVLDGDTTALLMAKHVKRWAFLGSLTSKWTPAFLSMYFETFQHMDNLQELSLSNIIIHKDFFKRLASIPVLKALTIENCSFHETVLEKHLKRFQSLPLKQLALLNSTQNNQLRRLVPYLNLSSLIRLELDIGFHLAKLSLPDSSLPLEYFYLGGIQDPLQVAQFLERTPHLKILHIPSFPSKRLSPLFMVYPHVIPQLTELSSSWSLCAQILPGRPISRLGVTSVSQELGENDMKVLANFKKPLFQLSIPISFYNNVSLWEHFPDLQNLELCGLKDEKVWGEGIYCAFKGNRHPKLCSLKLTFDNDISPSKIDSQEGQVLEFLNASFPALTSVAFSFQSLTQDPLRYSDIWSYTRVVGGSWHRTFQITHQRMFFRSHEI